MSLQASIEYYAVGAPQRWTRTIRARFTLEQFCGLDSTGLWIAAKINAMNVHEYDVLLGMCLRSILVLISEPTFLVR